MTSSADGAALYQALGLTARRRRVGAYGQVGLTSTLNGVELERVGGGIVPPATRETVFDLML